MNNDLIGSAESLLDEEVEYILALIARELHDFSELLVLCDAAIASPCLLESRQNEFEIEFIRESLDYRDIFICLSLLHTNV
jgi:hypothetical protein